MSQLPEGDAPNLQERLAESLPSDVGFQFYHVSTPPTKCAPLFSAPPGTKPERTYCECHFLTAAIQPKAGTTTENASEVLILAIEVLVYTTKRLTTIFVSKADSTGFLSLLSLPRSTSSPLRSITSTFVSWIVCSRQRTDTRLVVSLFARASNQYLFPGSVENPSKHVSDDRQLVKWWCRVLDPILQEYAPESPDSPEDATTSQAYLIVPGEDVITSFLPNDTRFNPQLRKRWTAGHPLREISGVAFAPPRCLVPHFPDDPKARYLDELDDELQDTKESRNAQSPSKRGNGQWRSIKTLEQFWDMMAYRQECSAGRLVGFIWIVFTPPSAGDFDQTDSQSTMGDPYEPPSPTRGLGKVPQFKPPTSIPAEMTVQPSKKTRGEKGHRRKPLTGPIISRLPRIKKSSSDVSTVSQAAESKYYYWPAGSRAELVLEEREYKKATELLLRLDFATLALAAKSSRTWIDEVGVLAGLKGAWGKAVMGKAVVPEPRSSPNGAAAPAIKNVPTMLVTKKRKVDEGKLQVESKTSDSASTLPSSDLSTPPAGSVNMLGSGLVRKRVKITPEPATADVTAVDALPVGAAAPAVNTLSAGLVRKKPKPT